MAQDTAAATGSARVSSARDHAPMAPTTHAPRTADPEPPTADADPGSGRPAVMSPGRLRSAMRWAPGIVVLTATAAVLVAFGTSLVDVLRYVGYVVGYVVLPGTLVYRMVRGRARSLPEDLALGTAVGLVLELGAWALLGALDLRSLLPLWPAPLVVLFLAVPRLRPCWRPTGATPVPAGWAWSVAAVALVALASVASDYFRWSPLVPGDGTRYYQDVLYHLSLAGEARHHLPLQVPQVAGEPLHYHWFVNAHLATAGSISGVELSTVLLRLYLPVLVIAQVVLLAVAGWRISGRPAVGALAAALTYVVGELSLNNGVVSPWLTVTQSTIWSSPSQTYSLVLLTAAVLVVAEWVAEPPDTRGARDARRRAVVLLPPLLIGVAGAKSAGLPVLLCGLLAVVAGDLVARRAAWRAPAAVALVAGVLVAASAVLYGGRSYGLAWAPWELLDNLGRGTVPGWPNLPDAARPGALWAIGGLWAASLLSRQLGIVVLLARRRLRLERAQLLLLGMIVSGVGAALLLGHPGWSQVYFLSTAAPYGAILSAWGFVSLVPTTGLSRRTAVLLGVLAVAWPAALAYWVVTWGGPRPGTGSALADKGDVAGALLPYTRPLLVVGGAIGLVAAVTLVSWLVALVQRRAGQAAAAPGAGPAATAERRLGRSALAGLVAGVLLLSAGVPATVQWVTSGATHTNDGRARAATTVEDRLVTDEMVRAARWVRDHSDPDDVVATNRHCYTRERDGGCVAVSFWVSAYTERRVLVESWGYAGRTLADDDQDDEIPYARLPFWDAERLADNDRVFDDPSVAASQHLAERWGVRWLVLDRRYTPEAPDLSGVASPRYSSPDVAVFELGPVPEPAASTSGRTPR